MLQYLKIFNSIYCLFPLAVILGLTLPGISEINPHIFTVILAAVVFLSAFKVQTREIVHINYQQLFKFYLGRFILLPVLLYLVFRTFDSQYATVILLLALAPAGVSSITFASILKADTATALIILLITSLSAPFYIPYLTELFHGKNTQIDSLDMLSSLSIIIFLPLLIHLPLRKSTAICNYINQKSELLIVYLIAIMTVFAVGMQRETFQLSYTLLQEFILSGLIFSIFYVLPYCLFKAKVPTLNAMSVCSGANNSGIPLVLSCLYLGALEIRFMIISDLVWIIAFIIYKYLIEKTTRSKKIPV